MKLLSIQLGSAASFPCTGSEQWWDQEWRSGFIKQPQTGPQWIGYQGIKGDEQADHKHHGGVDKAVCVYASEHYPYWREMLGLAEFPFGAFGENLTTEGLIETEVCVGDIFSLGEARLQISQPRQPCWKLARRWRVKDLAAQVEQNGFTGFYFRVLRHGYVEPGQTLRLEERLNPVWTIQRCNEIMHHQKDDAKAAAELSACAQLSGSWKDALWARSAKVNAASA